MNKLLLPLALLFALPAAAQDDGGEMLAGMSALRRQDHATAERSFSERIEVAPADLDAWYYRAVNRLTMSDLDGAMSDLDHLLRADPHHAHGLLRRSEARTAMNDRGGAQDDLRRLLNTLPEGPMAEHALFQLGHHAVMDGDMHKAHRHYVRLCTIAPHQAMAWCNLGIAQAALGQDHEALGSLDKAIDLDDTLDQAHVNRAIVLFRMDRREEACGALHRARALGDASVDEMLLIYCL
ncbi:MAG: tetratricopeptide repeat protein [Flavobacteriales bacterium]|nr:tetratricopeptide repeat protein [Flavobacteriales bacterium]